MNKQFALENLRQKMASDASLPLRETAANLVFGEGSVNPKVYFLGEAPGRYEDLSGRPFVGQAGKLLEKLLETIGLTREEVYITSVLRYRPPQNRDPKPVEIAAFKPYLDKEIDILKPKIIATLGRFSLNKFLPEAKISRVHGVPHSIMWNKSEIIIFPLYHPAAALRRKAFKAVLEADFNKLAELIQTDS
jgi:DNA polymerase